VKRELAIVATAWLALVAVCTAWLALDRRPPEWDYANHLERAVDCARDVEGGAWRSILERSSFYPPLVPCAAGLVYRAHPSDVAAAQSVILLFLGLGMLAVYLLGRRLATGAAGAAAAVIYGTAPFALFTALRFQLDLPLAAMVALTLWLLQASEGFARRGASLATGAVAGLGLLTKPPFVVYVVPVALWMLIGSRHRSAVVRAALASALAGAIALPWYGPRLFGLPLQITHRSFQNAVIEGKPETFSGAALAYYPTWSFSEFGILTVLLALGGLAVAAQRRLATPIVALLAPAVVFVLIQNKNLRYVLPLLPAVAALAGLGFDAARGVARRVLATAIVVVGALQVSATAFGAPPPVELPGLAVPWVISTPLLGGDWHHRDILALLERDSRGLPATVSVVPNAAFFSVSNFRYYAVRDGLALRFARAWQGEPLGVEYMILKDGDLGPSWTADKPRHIAELLQNDAALARAFPVLAEYPLPDGSTAVVRARRLAPGVQTPPAALARAVERAFRAAAGTVARDVDALDVRLVYDESIAQGRIARIELSAASATLAEYRRRDAARLRVHDARLVLHDVLVNPWAAADGRLEALDVASAELDTLTVRGDDLQAFMGELKDFRRAHVRLEPGALRVRMEQPGPDLAARVRVTSAADRPFALEFERVTLGWLPLPTGLANWVVRHYDPSGRIASRLPFPVAVGPIAVTPEAIRVGGDPPRGGS